MTKPTHTANLGDDSNALPQRLDGGLPTVANEASECTHKPKETMKLTRDTTEGNDVRVPTQVTPTRKPYPLTSDDRDLTPLGQECDERHPLRP